MAVGNVTTTVRRAIAGMEFIDRVLCVEIRETLSIKRGSDVIGKLGDKCERLLYAELDSSV